MNSQIKIGDKIHNMKLNQTLVVVEVLDTYFKGKVWFKMEDDQWWENTNCHLVVTKEMLDWANHRIKKCFAIIFKSEMSIQKIRDVNQLELPGKD